MATIVTLPSAPNTGLSRLGEVLLGSAADYSQQQQQRQREERLRADRLAEIEGARDFQREVYRQTRADRLSDVESDRAYADQQSEREARLALVRHVAQTYGLSPQDLDDPARMAAAFERARIDGVFARMPGVKEAVAAGDLSPNDLGSPDAVAAGLAAFSERLAAKSRFQEGLPQQATERANQLVAERQQLAMRNAELERRLSEPEPAPTPQEVAARALQLARATKKPGEMPSVQEIAAMEQQALQEVAGQKAMTWNQQRQDALVQRSLINDRLRDISSEMNTLTNRFGVVGLNTNGQGAPMPAGGAEAPTAAATPRMTPEQFAASLTAELEKRRGGGETGPVSQETSRLADAESGPSFTRPWYAWQDAPVPEVFQPAAAASGARGARLRESIGDSMRAFGQGVSNIFRPENWHGDFDASYYEVDPKLEAQQLRSRLARMLDQEAPAAVAIKNRLFQLQQQEAQRATQEAQATTSPLTTAMGTTPPAARQGLASRLTDVGY